MEVTALLVLGTFAGLDLVSGPQIMIARPLICGTIAGAIVGDVTAGITVGALLELFALEVLPVGAVRYPDYGPAAVGAVAAVAHAPLALGLGPAIALGLLVAWIGGHAMHLLRRVNGRRIRARRTAVERGDVGALEYLHWTSVALDAIRCAALTGFGLIGARVVLPLIPVSIRVAILLASIGLGIGLATATNRALTLATGPAASRWLAVGLIVGLILVVLI